MGEMQTHQGSRIFMECRQVTLKYTVSSDSVFIFSARCGKIAIMDLGNEKPHGFKSFGVSLCYKKEVALSH